MGDFESGKYGTLHEYRLHNADVQGYELLGRIAGWLMNAEMQVDPETALEEIDKLLRHPKACGLLKLLCDHFHVDYNALLDQGEIFLLGGMQDAKLLLHLLCLSFCHYSNSYVAEKLDIDLEAANHLIAYMKQVFIIGEPIQWLENLQHSLEQERHRVDRTKSKLLHGREAVQQAADTAEERKLALRKRFSRFIKLW